MNWYRFKIELLAWVWKTGVCVLTVLVYLKTVSFYGSGLTEWPSALEWFAYHPWSYPVALWTMVAVLWLCYWKAFKIMRGRRRYGTR